MKVTQEHLGLMQTFFKNMFPDKNFDKRVEMILAVIIEEDWEIEDLQNVLREFFCTLEYSNWLPSHFFAIYYKQHEIKDPKYIGRAVPNYLETLAKISKEVIDEPIFNEFKDLPEGAKFSFIWQDEGKAPEKITARKMNEKEYQVDGYNHYYTLLNNIKLTIE